ncbi:hypothetical protein Tco_0948711 [Tanacetum coccineum]
MSRTEAVEVGKKNQVFHHKKWDKGYGQTHLRNSHWYNAENSHVKRNSTSRSPHKPRHVEELSDKKSIEDEEVSLVDGVLKGALGALEALEIEALVDAKDVDNG